MTTLIDLTKDLIMEYEQEREECIKNNENDTELEILAERKSQELAVRVNKILIGE